MPRFCVHCGSALPSGGVYCPECGKSIASGEEPRPEMAAALDPSSPTRPAGHVQCPGCKKTYGEPGALCQSCGSKYPNQSLIEKGIGVAVVGAAIFGIGYLASWETIAGIGILVAIVGGVILASGSGRAGPEQKQSCCGCTCAVALLVLPASYLFLWSQQGAVVAILALPLASAVLRMPQVLNSTRRQGQ